MLNPEPGRNDMLTLNETGAEAGRDLFRTHEVSGSASVVRIDLVTGVAQVIFERADIERLDGLRWTPWGTLLTGEEVKTANRPDPNVQTNPAKTASANAPGADDLLTAYSGLIYEILDPTGDAGRTAIDPIWHVAFHRIRAFILKAEAAFTTENAFGWLDEFNSTRHTLVQEKGRGPLFLFL